MSHNIPFDIQLEIIKKVSDIKSLIRLRLVSKPWKSFIESSEFINGYGARNTQPHSFLLRYEPPRMTQAPYTRDDVKYVRLVEHDNNGTFKVQAQELAPSPLTKQFSTTEFIGACHGLVCLYGSMKNMFVIWNPSTRKSFGIADPNRLNSGVYRVYGFGVRPDTSDPTVVKIYYKTWQVEVFTLSSGVWNVIPNSNLSRQLNGITHEPRVVIDRFIYWVARDKALSDVVVSFDLITKEFKLIHLPDSLAHNQRMSPSLCKLKESLVVYGRRNMAEFFGVWVMQHDSSFKKLFSIHARVDRILGFRESGEPIFETQKFIKPFSATLRVYDPCSQQVNYLEIYGGKGTFTMGSYNESLLLLNHSDSRIYCDTTGQIDDNNDDYNSM